MHKYTERGGGSHAASCFCMLCGALRNFKHIGYPGGCRRCRALGIVYDEDGIQMMCEDMMSENWKQKGLVGKNLVYCNVNHPFPPGQYNGTWHSLVREDFEQWLR